MLTKSCDCIVNEHVVTLSMEYTGTGFILQIRLSNYIGIWHSVPFCTILGGWVLVKFTKYALEKGQDIFNFGFHD